MHGQRCTCCKFCWERSLDERKYLLHANFSKNKRDNMNGLSNCRGIHECLFLYRSIASNQLKN